MGFRTIGKFGFLLLLILIVLLSFKTSKVQTEDRIHIINLSSLGDAIVLESEGHFGVIDTGEDYDFPDGSDKRYPLRQGTIIGMGNEEVVLSYLQSLGINQTNLDFYIGTHPHSDHIGMAAFIIKKFHPQRVYIKPYKDEYISDLDRLWDNQYIYDRMLEATKEIGAILIQHFDQQAPVIPLHSELAWSQQEREREMATTGNPIFSLGNMKITLLNTGEEYLTQPVFDANLMSLGTLVEANGHRVFLAADIENRSSLNDNPDEMDCLENELAPLIGKVDVLKLGHHGLYGANSKSFLEILQPRFAILTGSKRFLYFQTMQRIFDLEAVLYATKEGNEQGIMATVIHLGDQLSISGYPIPLVGKTNDTALLQAKLGNQTVAVRGWYQYDDKWFYFDNFSQAATGWKHDGNAWFYLSLEDGAMQTGWIKSNDDWYYLDPTYGAMVKNTHVGKYYVNEEGKWIPDKWVKNSTGWWYRHGDGSYLTNSWEYIDDHWYYFDASGYMQSGWINLNGKYYYLYSWGGLAVNTTTPDGYRVDSDGEWIH